MKKVSRYKFLVEKKAARVENRSTRAAFFLMKR